MNIDKTLQKRILTGAIGIVLLFALIILGGTVGITLITAILVVLCAIEFFHMFYSYPPRPLQKWSGVLLTFLLFAIFVMEEVYLLTIFVLIVMGLFVTTLVLAKNVSQDEFSSLISDLGNLFLGAIYIAITFAFLPKLRGIPNTGIMLTILAFVIPWSGDTGAYFVGKKWGKRPLFQAVSPHKTVEGFLGGVGACIGTLLILKIIFFSTLTVIDCFFLGLLGTIFAHIGDLFESLLKRAHGLKDSGYLIPGHGGFLDRFDAFMFSTPIIYIYAVLFI